MTAAKNLVRMLDELGRVSDERGKLTRTFLSPAMRRANALVGGWMRSAGLTVRVDSVGNLIGRLASPNPRAKTLLLGSHLDTVRDAGNQRFLRQIYVHRAGHCTFTPAETITALENLLARLDTGHWPDLHADDLNAEAAILGPLNVAPPAFFHFHPAPFLRPFDTFIDRRCERHGGNEQHCDVDDFF